MYFPLHFYSHCLTWAIYSLGQYLLSTFQHARHCLRCLGYSDEQNWRGSWMRWDIYKSVSVKWQINKVIWGVLSAMKTKTKPHHHNEKDRDTCKTLLKLLPSSSPQPSPSPNTHPSYSLRDYGPDPFTWSLDFISFHLPELYVTVTWIQIPQLEGKLLWGQGLYLTLHIFVSPQHLGPE